MKLNVASTALGAAALLSGMISIPMAQGKMTKMCLFYDAPSGHARSDPIINQQCASGHVHTFYGPLNFHPDTTYNDLITTPPQYSGSPFVENQSLYWHPSIYEVTVNGDGTETYTRVSNLESSPYYRWDKEANPEIEAFPPGFRMIAASNDAGSGSGGETGSNMFTECCDYLENEEEDCQSWEELFFPERTCDFLGIAFNMPTCWNGELGDTNDHKDHMAFTVDGTVAGACPSGYDRRLPQVQLFVRIPNYKGGIYQLSDGNGRVGTNNVWHVDFFNGWIGDKLQEIIDGCAPFPDQEPDEFNPPCDCTFGEEIEQPFLTPSDVVAEPMCDSDVRRLILNEATDIVTGPLPTGSCQGECPLTQKSWNILSDDLFTCGPNPENCIQQTPSPPTPSPPTPEPPTPSPPTPEPPTPVTPAPPTPSPPTPEPPTPSVDGPTDMRWVVCGRGVGDGLKPCPEGDMMLVNSEDESEVHEVRCCGIEEYVEGGGWSQKCVGFDDELLAKSKVFGECHEVPFWEAFDICQGVSGRLCTKDEIMNSCAKGTGCRHDRELVWACAEEGIQCNESTECCGGYCHGDGFCIE